MISYTCVVVGGGIAGVSCIEQLCLEDPELDVLLVSASPLVKTVKNINKLSERLEEFDVEEEKFSYLEKRYPNCHVIYASALKLNSAQHELFLSTNQKVVYKRLCICTGALPKVVAKDHPLILGIRDTETIQILQEKLKEASRIIVIGNGGIAIEIVYEIEGCQVIWAIKDKSIGKTFFDAGAAHFFLPCLQEEKCLQTEIQKRLCYELEASSSSSESAKHVGSALGPDWSTTIDMTGKMKEKGKNVHMEYECELKCIYSTEEFLNNNYQEKIFKGSNLKTSWPLYVELTNGAIFGCDFVVSATGVVPNIYPFTEGNNFLLGTDSGIKVDDQMTTSVRDVFAAGDVCTASWSLAEHWFQMRLWTQAKQMGAYAARCIIQSLRGECALLDACFDLFTHVTRFFGYKVVLLGLFNAQKLGNNYNILLRISERKEYIKVVMQNGKMQGAILIGETDLEETFENLILNQLDLSSYGEDILNPNIDIEDYFD